MFQKFLLAALGTLIIAGVVLRFTALSAMEFKGDEFKALALAAAHLQNWSVPEVGLQSSTGLFNPPFFLVLLWPPLLFTSDPIVVTGWIVLLNAAGIIGLFFFLRKLGDTFTALSVAAVIATSPWLFVLSRKIWAQDALFPFLVLTSWLLMSYVRDRKSWKLIGAAAGMAMITQLHMSAWVMPVAVVVWLLLLRIRPRLREIIIGSAVFILLYATYITFHIQDGFENLSRTTTQDAGSLVSQLRWMVGVNGTVGLNYVWGPTTPAAISSGLLKAADIATWVIGIGAFLGLLLVIPRLRSFKNLDATGQYVLFLLILTVLSLAGFIVMGVPALPHYHLVFLPLVALLFTVALQKMCERIPLVGILPLAIAGIFIVVILQFQNLVTNHPDQLHGDYGVPYRNAQETWKPYIDAVRVGKMRLPE